MPVSSLVHGIVVICLLSSAAGPTNWQRVVELERGRRISVQLAGTPAILAVMVSADDATLSIQRVDNNQEEKHSRSDVIEISTFPNKRARNGAIAVAIIGFSSMIIGGLGKSPEAGPSRGYWIGLPLLVGGLVGIHNQPEQPVVIYRRPGSL